MQSDLMPNQLINVKLPASCRQMKRRLVPVSDAESSYSFYLHSPGGKLAGPWPGVNNVSPPLTHSLAISADFAALSVR